MVTVILSGTQWSRRILHKVWKYGTVNMRFFDYALRASLRMTDSIQPAKFPFITNAFPR